MFDKIECQLGRLIVFLGQPQSVLRDVVRGMQAVEWLSLFCKFNLWLYILYVGPRYRGSLRSIHTRSVHARRKLKTPTDPHYPHLHNISSRPGSWLHPPHIKILSLQVEPLVWSLKSYWPRSLSILKSLFLGNTVGTLGKGLHPLLRFWRDLCIKNPLARFQRTRSRLVSMDFIDRSFY